jgi:quinohemoprotein ethanol dehydrogenase
MKTGRPVERPGARYEDGSENVTPGPYGAHNFHAMSFNPNTGLVYLPTIHMSVDYIDKSYDKTWQSVPFEGGTAVDYIESSRPRSYAGSLQAWDPIAQRQVWFVEQQSGQGAGTLTTAGDLVFQGRSDGLLKAYHARTGKELWSFDAGLGISAPPITYKLGDTQYLSILVGYGGGNASRLTPGSEDLGWAYGVHTRRLLTFAFNGKDVLPKQPPPFYATPILEPGFTVDPALAADGEKAYLSLTCYACHGIGGIAGGMAPDLRASPMALSEMEAAFTSVVRDGERVARGMPGFPAITDAQLNAIRHYIRREARAASSNTGAAPGTP